MTPALNVVENRLIRKIKKLEGSSLYRTRNMNYFNAKVLLYKEVQGLKDELKKAGVDWNYFIQ